MHGPMNDDKPVEVDSESVEVADGELERCEVTGELVPSDELSLFQGNWVSP